MPVAPSQISALLQRLALLKQYECELQIQFSQSYASLADTEALESELIAVAEEIADLELALTPAPMTRVA